MKKISRCARNDSVGDGYPVHHTKNVWKKHVSRIVIGSRAEGSFSLAVRRRASDGEKRETPYHGKWKRRASRIVIPCEVEGSFSLTVRRSVFDSEERETSCRGKTGTVFPVNGLAKKSGKKGTKKISRCARNDSVGDGYPVHHTKNVWKKHVSRIVIGSGAEGSFSLAVRRSVFDSEKRETPYHGKWKRRVSRIVIGSEVEGSFSLAVRRRASDSRKREIPYRGKADGVSRKRLGEGGGKRGTEKISRYARNDSVGDGYPVHHTKNVWEKHVSRIVIGSRAEGSFSLAVRRRVSDSEERETPCRGKVDGVSRKRLSEGEGKRGTEKISRYARNDSVGDGYPVHHTKNVWEKRSSRSVIGSGAEGSFSLMVRRRASDSRKREIPYRGKVDGVSHKRLSEGVVGKRGRKRFLAALEMTVWGDGYPLYRIKFALGKYSSRILISRYA